MKHRLLLILGYYLYVQAFIATLNICGTPEYSLFLLTGAVLSGWGAYSLVKRHKQPPAIEPIPDTQPLSAIQHASNPTKPVEKL